MSRKLLAILCIAMLPVVAIAHDKDASDDVNNNVGQCVKEAKAVKNQAIADAISIFKEKKAACKGGSSICVEGCSDVLAKVLAEIRAPLNACKEACREALPERRASCKAEIGCGSNGQACRKSAEFLKCVKAPQVEAFACVKDCKIEFRSDTVAQEALKKARTDFKSCLVACQ